VIETACQLPPPTDLPNTFSDCTWEVTQEIRAHDEPCLLQALTKEIVIQQKTGRKTKHRFPYTEVADILVDDNGETLTIGMAYTMHLMRTCPWLTFRFLR
jgi:hypothetical protein